MRIIVDVTQAHIDKGVREDCRECPVALAMRPFICKKWHLDIVPFREENEAKLILYVNHNMLSKIEIVDPEKAMCVIKLSHEMYVWITSYDRKEIVGPISFVIELPKELLAEGILN